MSGTKAVLDSNAIIYASNGTIDAEKLLSGSDKYYASIITCIEVYAFDFPQEQNQKDKTPRRDLLASAKFINADLITNNYADFQNIDPSVNVLNLDAFKLENDQT